MAHAAPIRVGVLGLDHWYWATSMIPALVKDPRFELAAIWEPAAWRLRATKYPARRIARTAAEITDDPAIDLVVSFLPCPANARWLTRAARHGKAVVSNKPVAMSVAQGRPLAAALRRSGRPSYSLEGGAPLTRRAGLIRGILARGRLGAPLTATFSMRGGMPMAWWDRGGQSGRANWGWWTDPRQVPGGAWIDHSIYALAEARYLLRDVPVSVQATMARVKYSRQALGLEDYGIATYRYSRGTVVTMEYDWIGGLGSAHSIICARGAIRWGGAVPAGHVEVRGPKGTKLVKVPQGPAPSVLDQMAGAIRQRRATVSPVSLGLENLRLALAAYRSSRTGRMVRV